MGLEHIVCYDGVNLTMRDGCLVKVNVEGDDGWREIPPAEWGQLSPPVAELERRYRASIRSQWEYHRRTGASLEAVARMAS